MNDIDRLESQLRTELTEQAAPKSIGIDVIQLGAPDRGGAKSSCIAVSDLDSGQLLWVHRGKRSSVDLDTFFEVLGPAKSSAIELVLLDFQQSFISSTAAHAPQARMVHSKFHLDQHLCTAFESVRKNEYQRLRQDKGTFTAGAHFTLLLQSARLKLSGAEALEKLQSANQRLYSAYLLKDGFDQLWAARSPGKAHEVFEHWKAQQENEDMAPFREFAERLEAHWQGVAGNFLDDNKARSAVLERIHTDLRQTLERPIDQHASTQGAGADPITTDSPPEGKPAPVTRTGSADSPLASWFELLCQMLPNVRQALVLEVGQQRDSPPALFWPAGGQLSDQLVQAARDCLQQGHARTADRVFAHPLRADGRLVAAVSLELQVETGQSGTVQQLLGWSEQWLRLLLRSDPETGNPSSVADSGIDSSSAASALLPLVDEILQSEDFAAAVIVASNRLATSFGCERVALGLYKGKRTRILALSHGVEFDRRTRYIQALEAVLEISRSSGLPIVWSNHEPDVATPDVSMPDISAPKSCAAEPSASDASTGQDLQQALRQLREQGYGNALCVVPLHGQGGFTGALLCERLQGGFSEDEVNQLSLAGRLLGPVLELKRDQSRLLWRRAVRLLTRSADQLVSPGHSAFKIGTAGAIALALVLAFFPGQYRVSADAAVEGLVQRAVVAPFDGYIDEALARAGDAVAEGATIARMDDRELRLELRKLTTEEDKLENEYRKALAALDRSESRLVQSRLAQARAQTNLLSQKLERVQLNAPIAGIIISGDLSRSLGAPVERGEVLFEIAPVDQHRLVLHVDERDIADVAVGQQGFVTLTALPSEPLGFTIERISPIFQEQDGRVTFRTEARLEEQENSLRPGMDGIGKVDVGKRSLGWILFHDLIDWLRLQLWLWLP